MEEIIRYITEDFIKNLINAFPLIYTADAESASIIESIIHGRLITDQYPAVNGLNITSFRDDLITGTVDAAPGSGLYTSITYDAGWRVYVDGKKVDTMPVYSGFLGANIPAGAHEIRLSFIPIGLISGFLLSIGSCIALLFFHLFRRREKARPKTNLNNL